MSQIFKKGQKATIKAGGVTVFLAILKGLVGLISGSVVLIGDALHSLADSFSTFSAWLGLKISKKKPTKKFPYGFYKAENLSALIISGLILFAGINVLKESISKIATISSLEIPILAIITAVLDGTFMFLVGSYEMKVGKEIGSDSLQADGKESKLHILTSSIVIVGLVASIVQIPYLEGAAGIVISLFIFEAAFETFKDSILALMDVSPSKDLEKKVKEILNDQPEIYGFKELKLRKAGPLVFGEVTIETSGSFKAQKASEVIDKIEEKVKEIEKIDSFNVSLSHKKPKRQKIAIPIEKEEESLLDSEISPRFGKAKKFLLINFEKEVKDMKVKENLFKDKKIRAGLNTASSLIEKDITTLISYQIGPIAFHALKDKLVLIYRPKERTTAKEAIKKLKQNNLEELKEPTKEKK